MKLFVGRLPFDLTEDELRELFEQYGGVTSAKIIFDRDTGRSRGFGFVEMPSSDEGQDAMEKLDGSSVQGRTIVVNPAHDSSRR